MVYQNKIVLAVKARGKVLRERDGVVTLPFGEEYSLLIKNLHSVRIQVKASIDGDDVTEDTRLIIDPNSEMELERFIRNGNMKAGNRFRFIERSAAVEAHRGIKADDGIVRVETWVEHVQQFVNVPLVTYYPDYRPWPYWPHDRRRQPRHYGSNDFLRSSSLTSSASGNQINYTATSSSAPAAFNCNVNNLSEVGVTVPGSVSHQQFHTVMNFPVEPTSNVIVLQLRGTVGTVQVQEPLTVKAKTLCVTCGRSNKQTSKYCAQCGTALELI